MGREWTIKHKESILDTVQMERISYVKSQAFYFGLSYTLIGLQGGITPMLGYIYKNHDLQLSYTFGTTKSDEGYVYQMQSNKSWDYQSGVQYKENTFAIKYGYQIALMGRIAITPQLGFAMHSLSCSNTDLSTKYADGAKANSLTLGARVAWVPMQHLYAFVAPQMGFIVKQDDAFKYAADQIGFNGSGFGISIGVMANF